MNKFIIFFSLIFLVAGSKGQAPPKEYYALIHLADSFYYAKDYKKSAFAFSHAFNTIGWKGTIKDRINAACSWALANYPDSAFFNLFRLANHGFITDYNWISADLDLKSLHKDKRWPLLLEKVKHNRDSAERNLNMPLVHMLDTILDKDQKYRQQLDEVEKNPLWSKEVKAKANDSLWRIIAVIDATNLKRITAILDKYGWLGPDVVGERGNSTLFLVIQHSDQKTQEKYLPMMREAVKNKKASPSELALLEDRVALGQGKKQIYGSQIRSKDGVYEVSPLEDPDNVDKRRAEVGLPPLATYVEIWGLKWDVEKYKKSLQEREKGDQSEESVAPTKRKYFWWSGLGIIIIIAVSGFFKRRRKRQDK